MTFGMQRKRSSCGLRHTSTEKAPVSHGFSGYPKFMPDRVLKQSETVLTLQFLDDNFFGASASVNGKTCLSWLFEGLVKPGSLS